MQDLPDRNHIEARGRNSSVLTRLGKDVERATAPTRRKHVHRSARQEINSLPVGLSHKIRRNDENEQDIQSYFKSALEKWSELNLSIPFTEFLHEVEKKSKSLQQVIHHQEEILQSLWNAIARQDELTLVALLDLLVQLIRDLQSDFERYVPIAIAALVPLTKVPSAAVSKAVFETFIYVFTHLQGPLSKNPIPVYDAFAALLARDKPVPDKIIERAANAFSSLLRHVPANLREALLQHICLDVQVVETVEYTEGVCHLIAEAMKGVKALHSVHANGIPIMESLLLHRNTSAIEESSHIDTILENVTIHLLHHCTAETFDPVLQLFIGLLDGESFVHRTLGWRLCFISCAVRKGSRISSKGSPGSNKSAWARLLESLSRSLVGSEGQNIWQAVRFASVLLTYAPHTDLIVPSKSIISAFDDHDPSNLLILANTLVKQDVLRFETFVLPQYRRSILQNWNATSSLQIVLNVNELSKSKAFASDSSSCCGGRLKLSDAIVNDVVSQVQGLMPSCETQARLLSLIHFLAAVSPPEVFQGPIIDLLARSLAYRNGQSNDKCLALLIGSIFNKLKLQAFSEKLVSEVFQHSGLWTTTSFLRGFSKYLVGRKTLAFPESIRSALIDNLGKPGHSRRLYSIRILQQTEDQLPEVESDLMSVCEIIESTDLTSEATRGLEMQIRKLNQNYCRLRSPFVKSLVTKLSMGLLLTNYTPFWKHCCETLAIIAETEPDLIWSLSWKWFLEVSSMEEQEPVLGQSSHEWPTVIEAETNSFRCFNTAALKQNYLDARNSLEFADDVAERLYAYEASSENEVNKVTTCSQAIRIFSAIPEMAERHSRDLVPIFLDQFESPDEEEDSLEDNDVGTPVVEEKLPLQSATEGSDVNADRSGRLNKKDRQSLLVLFSKFVNPAAFYEAEKYRSAVMELLADRDSRIQTLAFQILIQFREPGLKRYEDNLRNLLSDSRSRDEITTFLQTDVDQSTIQDQHRSHVMPIVARILFGKMINRRHATSQKKGLANSRNIILSAIATLPTVDIAHFITVFLRSFDKLEFLSKSGSSYQVVKDSELEQRLSLRKQIGFCTMTQDALVQLGSKVMPFVEEILDALIYCCLSATDIINSTMDVDVDETKVRLKIARNIRHSVYQSLDLLFQYCRSFNWTPYLNIIFTHFVNPRLEKLPQESSQNPSVVLRLLSTWASSPSTSPLLVEHNPSILPKIFECLSEKSIKDSVCVFVLNIVKHLCEQVKDVSIPFDDRIRNALLPDQIELLLMRMSELLERQKFSSSNNTINCEFLDLEIEVLSSISSFATGDSASQSLLDLLIPLLSKPRKAVADTIKDGVLVLIENMLPLSRDYKENSDTLWKKYNAIGSLFGSCSSRSGRTSLTNILHRFAANDSSILEVATTVTELNSFSNRRIDTPDFDRRLAAFAQLNEQQFSELTPRAWRPLLYNMIFFVGDDQELALRTNATYSIRRLLEVTKNCREEGLREQYLRILETDLMPAVKKGMRHQQELIRQEWVSILGSIVKECSFWSQIGDMVPLLVGGDEEANFFYNVLHIQQHRRIRALHRLVSISQVHEIRSENIAHVLLPLIEHYCFVPKDESHNLIRATVTTIGELARSMRYNQYCALLKRYIGLLRPSATNQKTVVKLIAAVVDAFVGQQRDITPLDLTEEQEANETVLPFDNEYSDPMDVVGSVQKEGMLQRTQAGPDELHAMVINNFLAPLTKYLHSKDEETVDLRIPVALPVIKLLTVLPHESLIARLPAVLTDVCHILRSRSQDARDKTRDTLGNIAKLLGPNYVIYVLDTLQTALQRGYQLHVLGWTVHTILQRLNPDYGSLDYCLDRLVEMLIDDIFGETGKEKDAEDYITKMKEMKTNKSFDSFFLLASNSRLANLGELIMPLKGLLASTSDLKTVRKIDEVFRRVTLGIMKNKACGTRDSLLLCYNVYEKTMVDSQEKLAQTLSIGEQARKDSEHNYLVDLRARKTRVRDHMKANAHKLIKFSLETTCAVLHQHASLQTAQNLADFVPIIGDSMMSGHEDVHIAALTLLTEIIKIDLRTLDSGAPVFVEQAVSFIRESSSTETELCQAALKFVSAILMERKSVTIKDSILAYLLVRIKTDIEEPDRQKVTFSFLWSIMSRKFMVVELYDVMDRVRTMLVTNQSKNARGIARSAYIKFLSEYPQSQDRLRQQLAFLVKNLQYVYSTGRQSVMEVLNMTLIHFDDALLQEHLMTLYLACTMAMVNDDEASCREMAAALLRKIHQRADKERSSTMTAALRSWAYNEDILLQRASMQGFGLLFEVKEARPDDLKFFMEKLNRVLSSNTRDINAQAEVPTETLNDFEDEDSTTWPVLYYSLRTFSTLLMANPEKYITKQNILLWSNIQKLLLYQHAWIRSTASRLLGTLLDNNRIVQNSSFTAGKDLTLEDIDLVRIARHSLIQLQSDSLSDDLAAQINMNLVFLLRFFKEKGTILPPKEDGTVAEDTISDASVTCVEWLLNRVSKLLQSDKDVKAAKIMLLRRSLLRFIAAAIKILSVDTALANGVIIARPIFKYVEASAFNQDQQGIKDLATEVFELFKDKIGQTRFAEIYTTLREAQKEIRLKRKYGNHLGGEDGERKRAQKKEKKNIKKSVKRTEKAQQFKRKREMHHVH